VTDNSRDIDALRKKVEQAYGRWRACVEELAGPAPEAAVQRAAQEECRKLQTAYETAVSALHQARGSS
jgi:3'-phosphoadenosine 5'-phosphosulfate sulfotransferase